MPENVYRNNLKGTRLGSLFKIKRIMVRFLQVTGFTLFLFGVSWGLLAGYHWLVNTPRLGIEKVRITGNHHFDDEKIMKKAGISREQNILGLKIQEVKSRLVRDPWIDSVRIRRELPRKLHIRIWEKEPAFWIVKENRMYYADKKGRDIGPVQADQCISFPLLVFDDASAYQQHKLDLLVRSFVEKQWPFSLAESSWLRFLAAGELVELFLHDRGLKVVLNTRGLSRNIDCLKRIWRDLNGREELDGTARILVSKEVGWVKKEHQG